MAPQLVNSTMADGLLSALCNTLLHSLWQGIILAAIAGIIVIATRKASSALRYNLLVSAMLLFAIGVCGTFTWQYSKYVGPLASVSPAAHVNIPHVNTPQVDVPQAQVHVFINGKSKSLPNFSERWGNFLADHHDTIVLVWFLIVCARSLQLAFGLYGTYRLRRVSVSAVKDKWLERMQQLADALGIMEGVVLLESGLAKVPMVIGYLKPVILVPVGLLTALSAEEVEAILIHELAHIKRRDYLVNMLQSLMEIVFFFNPAVLWVSKLIKTERENCCDDLALAQNNNKVNYIRALVSCEEFQASVPPYAMGFPGGKHTLLDRVKRLANNKNHSLNSFEKTVLGVCLVALGLGVSAFTAREDIAKAVNKVVAAIQYKVKEKDKEKVKIKLKIKDTLKLEKTAKENDANAALNKLLLLHHDTLKTTGSPELDALIHNMDTLRGTNSLASGLNAQRSGQNANLSGLNANLSGLRGGSNPSPNPLAIVYKSDTNQLKLHGGLLKLQEMNPKAFKVMHDIGMELYRERLITDTNHLSISLNEQQLIVNGTKMSQDVHDRIYNKFGQKGWNGSYSSNYPDASANDSINTSVKVPVRVKSNYGDAYANAYANTRVSNSQKVDGDKQTQNIINDMLRDGIITTTDNLSFKIGTTEFVVNYKKQTEAIYQRYKAKYVPAHKKGDWIWYYKFNTNEWDRARGHNNGDESDGAATGVFQGKEDASTGDNTSGYNYSTPAGYAAGANGYRNSGARYEMDAKERQRIEAERDKKLVADLMQDGLITDPNNVTFTLSNKKLEINGKKQSEETYQKYRQEYVPNNTGNWSWTYSHHE